MEFSPRDIAIETRAILKFWRLAALAVSIKQSSEPPRLTAQGEGRHHLSIALLRQADMRAAWLRGLE